MPFRQFTKRLTSQLPRQIRNNAKNRVLDRLARNGLANQNLPSLLERRTALGNKFDIEFPIGLRANDPHLAITISDTKYETEAGGTNSSNLELDALQAENKRIGNLGLSTEYIGSIFLPLPVPGDLKQTTGVQYTTESFGPLARAIGQAAKAAFAKGHDNIFDGIKAFWQALESSDIWKVAGDSIRRNLLNFASGLLPGVNIKAADQYYRGKTLNPNDVTLFENIEIREYTFSWVLIPRNFPEAKTIRGLVRTLEQLALPSGSTTGVYLRQPLRLSLGFYGPEGNKNIQLFEIQDSYITNVDVEYNSGLDVNKFFDDGNGVQYPITTGITLSIKEYKPPNFRSDTVGDLDSNDTSVPTAGAVGAAAQAVADTTIGHFNGVGVGNL